MVDAKLPHRLQREMKYNNYLKYYIIKETQKRAKKNEIVFKLGFDAEDCIPYRYLFVGN